MKYHQPLSEEEEGGRVPVIVELLTEVVVHHIETQMSTGRGYRSNSIGYRMSDGSGVVNISVTACGPYLARGR
jgi:hypothetical protein